MATPPLDIPAVAAAYEKRGLSTPAFYHHLDEALRVRALAIPGLDWTLLDHLLSTVRTLRLQSHFEAFAEGAGIPYEGLEPFLEAAVAAGIFDEGALRRTPLPELDGRNREFGRLLVKLGLATKDQIRAAEEIRDSISSIVGIEPALGCILRSTARLSVVDFIRALAVYRGVEGETLDELAEAVYDASCQRMTLTTRTVGR